MRTRCSNRSSNGNIFTISADKDITLYQLNSPSHSLLITANSATMGVERAPSAGDVTLRSHARSNSPPSRRQGMHLNPQQVAQVLAVPGQGVAYRMPGVVSADAHAHRPSAMMPASHVFQSKTLISYFSMHNASLQSGSAETLLRILQGKQAAVESYGENLLQSDYLLTEIHRESVSYGGEPMRWGRFVCASLLEAEHLRESPVNLGMLGALNQCHKQGIVVARPDVLVVRSTQRLSAVLSRPELASYTRVYCAFGRNVMTRGEAAGRGLRQVGEATDGLQSSAQLERKVVCELVEMNLLWEDLSD